MTKLGPWLLLTVALTTATASPAVGEPVRVLTYNLWHGFWRTADKELVVLPSEGAEKRSHRQAVQIAELERLRPDVLMAQEVHPLPWRARELARALEHRSVHQLVSCGVRVLHVGVPWSVRSGLVMTARRDLDLVRVAAPLLSGRYGLCNDWLGLQVEEARRALIGRIELEDGRRLLLVTTHLHSSTEGGAARGERRLREVEGLLDAIEAARREDRSVGGVILGGDFNALEDSKAIERLHRAGFVDTVEWLGVEFATYDPWANELAAQMTRAGGGDPAHSAPRRIDYLFVSEELAGAIRSVSRYGAPEAGRAEDAGVDSDHYGVLLELDL